MYYDPHGKIAWNCNYMMRKDMKSISRKAAYLKEFKSLVYMLLLYYVVTDLAQYKSSYKFNIYQLKV